MLIIISESESIFMSNVIALIVLVFIFLKEDFIRKSAKTTLLYTYKIYTCMYIPPPATYANTIHNTK